MVISGWRLIIIVLTLFVGAIPVHAWGPGVIPIIPLKRTEKEIIRNMVRIPSGKFVFGEGASTTTLNSPEFYIDKQEVTNAEFIEFIKRFGNGRVGQGAVSWLDVDSPYCLIERDGFSYRVKPGCEYLPVVEVSWFGARAYAEWQNKRLPTEAEWEKAARGENGSRYPWGDKLPEKMTTPPALLLNFYRNDRSGFGVLNMAGGAWEWCGDTYYPNPATVHLSEKEGFADYRVVKGGTWRDLSNVQSAVRSFSAPFDRTPRLGFRCAYPLN